MCRYGSVSYTHLDVYKRQHLSLIPIPVLDDKIISRAHDNVITYSKNMGEAIKKESQAIALIEQEIESWNKK